VDNAFTRDMKEWENDPEYQAELLILDINEQICELMEKQNVSRAELARRIGKDRAYISRMLNGSPNITIMTLTKVAMALESRPEFHLVSNCSVKENEPDIETIIQEKQEIIGKKKMKVRERDRNVA